MSLLGPFMMSQARDPSTVSRIRNLFIIIHIPTFKRRLVLISLKRSVMKTKPHRHLLSQLNMHELIPNSMTR